MTISQDAAQPDELEAEFARDMHDGAFDYPEHKPEWLAVGEGGIVRVCVICGCFPSGKRYVMAPGQAFRRAYDRLHGNTDAELEALVRSDQLSDPEPLR